MELTGNLYDYPRESIERRKLLRQMRRIGSHSAIAAATGDESALQRQIELRGSIPDLEKELAKYEEMSRMTGA